MKILILCNRIPYPVNDGWTIAVYNMIKGLAEAGNQLTVLSFNTKKHYFPVNELPVELSQWCTLHTVYLDASIKPIDAFLNLFSKKSYHITRFISKSYERKLASLLKEQAYDLIQVEGLSVTPYLPIAKKYSKAKMVYRAHNVEHVIWKRLCQSTPWGIKRGYLKLLANRLQNFEQQQITKFDALVPITDEDKKWMRAHAPHVPCYTAAAGLDIKKLESVEIEPNSIFHLGALDWMPNQEGVKWFLDQVWPIINEKNPQLKLYIAGKNTPADFFNWNIPGVKVLGQVPDATAFMLSKQVMIVPLLSGSGMRLKVIEGMSLGKLIVSTTIGAEGVVYEHEKNIFIEDEPARFATRVLACVHYFNNYASIGIAAADTASKEYNYRAITAGLMNFYTTLLK